MRRRTSEGMTKGEVACCLKHYVGREVYLAIQNPIQTIAKSTCHL